MSEIDQKIKDLERQKEAIVKEQLRLELQPLGITDKQFQEYEAVRLSGATNMFNLELVTGLSGLTRKECYAIMQNYGKLKQLYGSGKAEKLSQKIGLGNFNTPEDYE